MQDDKDNLTDGEKPQQDT